MKSLFSAEQVREADKFAIDTLKIPGIVLMENAAAGICDILEDYISEAGEAWVNSVTILCGKGNNGGDGFALARYLANKGYPVNIVTFANSDELKGDAKVNHDICLELFRLNNNPEIHLYSGIESLEKFRHSSVIVDAMLGSGAKGELKEPYNEVVKLVNSFNGLKLAVDIPTGLNADTGKGEIVFNADLTVCLGELKKGLFVEDGYALSGEVVKGSIGIGNNYFNKVRTDTFLTEREDVINCIPERGVNVHKYSAGKTFVIAGSAGYPGAARFTTEAAFAAGSGAVVLALPKSVATIAALELDGPVVNSYNDNSRGYLSIDNYDEIAERIAWSDCTVIGPGLGCEKETIECVAKILKDFPDKKMVLDADALQALHNKAYEKFNLTNKILTPHHKEFTDFTGFETIQFKNNVLEAGRRLSAETGAVLVLKGAPTIIFDKHGNAFINQTGNSGMAKFGTGDVLSGIIGSFAAQGGEITESPLAGVYLHSLAADILVEELSEYSLTPLKLIDYFPKALKELYHESV